MKGIRYYYRLTISQSFLAAVILLGVFATCIRRLEGWKSWIRLKETFPWGLCSGLDVSCGLAVAAGGFTIVAALYLSGREIYRPVLRAGMLLGFLGFIAAVLATVANRPFHYWAFAGWSPWGAFLGPASALPVYGALLVMEFLSDAVPRGGRHLWISVLHFATVVLAVLAAVLSTAQQASLNRLLVTAPTKFSPLWLTPMLSAHIFLSSILACLALIIFASWHISVTSARSLSPALIGKIAQVMAVLLPWYVSLRFLDLFDSSAFPLLFNSQPCNYYLGIELCLFLLPALLLLRGYQNRTSRMLYFSAVLVIAGFAVNRLNVTISAREALAGVLYIPQWIDLMIASSVIALCALLFNAAVRHLAIFSQPGVNDAKGAMQPTFCREVG